MRFLDGFFSSTQNDGVQDFESMTPGTTTTVSGSTHTGDTEFQDDHAVFNQRGTA
jgi:hypothetical protein